MKYFIYSMLLLITSSTCHAFFYKTDRGVEIRYTKKHTNIQAFPAKITVEEKDYMLFKTKEDALLHVKYATIKRDMTIVYVVSQDSLNAEIVTIEE